MITRRAFLVPVIVLVTLLLGCSTAAQRGNPPANSAPPSSGSAAADNPANRTPPDQAPVQQPPTGQGTARHSPGALKAAKQRAKIAGCPAGERDASPRSDGLPDITLPCLGGGKSVPLAGLRGKPMVITVWAQWCIPCRQEAPYLAEAAERSGDKITMLGIDYNDPHPADAIDLAGKFGWRFPQIQDRHKKIAEPLHILGPPVTLMVDQHGKLVYRHAGPFTSFSQLQSAVDDHLEVRL